MTSFELFWRSFHLFHLATSLWFGDSLLFFFWAAMIKATRNWEASQQGRAFGCWKVVVVVAASIGAAGVLIFSYLSQRMWFQHNLKNVSRLLGDLGDLNLGG